MLLFSCKYKKELPKEIINESFVKKNTSEEDFQSKLKIINFEELNKILHQKNDTTYVVNFWATWCKPCVKELPYFEKIGEQFASEKVKVILVSIDNLDQIKRVETFIKKRNIKSNCYLINESDPEIWMKKVDSSWNGSVPATVLFNATNRKFFETSLTFEKLYSELQLLQK